ncbi:EamA family transporter [Buttiauxella sp. WJP83]|uniref:EamA family transporter n=1 Tax=Buttiauxella sp. WJP83 TaxID=2986951 RepID=UPI003FA494E8
MVVLSKLDVTVAYPLLSLGYVITTVIGYYFLNESVNTLKVAGLVFICIGIICVSKSA